MVWLIDFIIMTMVMKSRERTSMARDESISERFVCVCVFVDNMFGCVCFVRADVL